MPTRVGKKPNHKQNPKRNPTAQPRLEKENQRSTQAKGNRKASQQLIDSFGGSSNEVIKQFNKNKLFTNENLIDSFGWPGLLFHDWLVFHAWIVWQSLLV